MIVMLLMNGRGVFECDPKKVAEKLGFSDEDFEYYGKNGEKLTIKDAQMLGTMYFQFYLGTYDKFLGYMLHENDDQMLINDYDQSQLSDRLDDPVFGHYAGD